MAARGKQADLHVDIDRAVLFNFRRAVEDVHGTRHGKIAIETEAALKAWTKNLKERAQTQF